MIIDSDFPTVFLPIVVLVRELDGKLVLASELAAKGCRVVVGYKETLKSIGSVSIGGVWQGKSLFTVKSSNRSAIMFFQDEGGIHQVKNWSTHVFRKHRIDCLRKLKVNRICVWGERQKKLLSSYAEELKDVIVVTGNPIFDLCLHEYTWVNAVRTEALSKRYGRFILVCTRFTGPFQAQADAHEFWKKMHVEHWGQTLDQEKVMDIWFSKWQRDVHDFADIVVLIKELASNFPQYTIVVRPHPGENLAFYQQAFESFKNVVVIREGSVQPWICAASLVVHSNCTTGVEAVLLRRPVLNFLPAHAGRDEFDVEVAREAGRVAATIRTAIQKAGDLLTDNGSAHSWSVHAKTILNNLTQAAIPRMLNETMSVIEEQRITSSRLVLPRTKARETIRRFVKGDDQINLASKRWPLDAKHVAWIIDTYRERHGKGGRMRRMTEKYVVIDPA